MGFQIKVEGYGLSVYKDGIKVDFADAKTTMYLISSEELTKLRRLLNGEKIWYNSKIYTCRFSSTRKEDVSEINHLTALLQQKQETIFRLQREIETLKNK